MSPLEAKLRLHIKAFKLPEPVYEHRFHPSRQWRFDAAWPTHMVAVECEGGIWSGGRHTRGAGFIEDCRKYNEAQALGWVVLRITNEHLDSGEAIAWLMQLLDVPSACIGNVSRRATTKSSATRTKWRA